LARGRLPEWGPAGDDGDEVGSSVSSPGGGVDLSVAYLLFGGKTAGGEAPRLKMGVGGGFRLADAARGAENGVLHFVEVFFVRACLASIENARSFVPVCPVTLAGGNSGFVFGFFLSSRVLISLVPSASEAIYDFGKNHARTLRSSWGGSSIRLYRLDLRA